MKSENTQKKIIKKRKEKKKIILEMKKFNWW